MDELEIRQILANNLKKIRKQKGLSQLRLSNEIQMAFTFINDIENCKKWVSPETLARFSTFFDVPVSYFFQNDIEEESNKNINNEVFIKTITEELSKTITDVSKRFLDC
ncbi:MAG: helix-turn-helix transcriptional regulator [Spirochaetaceae bacterium]|nr:helix-turn-helix transcriptional regulator [Spirochaetaceae bacterium]